MPHVQAVFQDGSECFLSPEVALSYIKAGEAEPLGGWRIAMKGRMVKGVRGPSCGVQGSARRGEVSYLEHIATKDKGTLEEIRRISRGVAQLVTAPDS